MCSSFRVRILYNKYKINIVILVEPVEILHNSIFCHFYGISVVENYSVISFFNVEISIRKVVSSLIEVSISPMPYITVV